LRKPYRKNGRAGSPKEDNHSGVCKLKNRNLFRDFMEIPKVVFNLFAIAYFL